MSGWTLPIKLVRTIKRTTGARTWHIEMVVVAAVLTVVAVATRKPWTNVEWLHADVPVEWIGSVAVFLTFGHAQIAFRLQEAQERVLGRDVECHWKAVWYFLSKEACWFTFFTLLGAWSALVGVFIFLLYPWWRAAWVKAKSA